MAKTIEGERSPLLLLGLSLALAVAVAALMLAASAKPALAATLTVDRLDDPIPVGGAGACTAAANDCSLRGAILKADTNGQTDTIGFALPAGPQTITIAGALAVEDDTPTDDLTINGPGQNLLTVRQSVELRVFEIVGKATIKGITISGGRSPNSAGGILNYDDLTLNDTTVTDNQALGTTAGTGAGGGILNASGATLTLNRSTVSANKALTATGYGGGIYNDTGGTVNLNDSSTVSANASAAYGGGIYNNGTLNSNNSTVNGINTATHGGGLFNSVGTATLNNSTISANEAAPSDGGGLLNDGGTLTLNSSAVSTNLALSGSGGGIVNQGNGTATLNNSTVSGNQASSNGNGGGIINDVGTLNLNNSTVSTNTARYGGGIYSGTTLASPTERTTVRNSTISGNTATSAGGGIDNAYGRTVIEHSTITNNTAFAGAGSGVSSYGDTSLARTALLSSIVSANTNTDVDFRPGDTNSFVSNGSNLIGDGNATTAFNQSGDQANVANPGLNPLASNGGPTQTHALVAGSSAIDTGPSSCPATDQRGKTRPKDGDGNGSIVCDIGAFEKEAATACSDGKDNDRDGKIDYPRDKGCKSATDNNEKNKKKKKK